MSYICVKKLSLGGTEYYPGDNIPDGAIFPWRIKNLLSSGYITELQEMPEPPESADSVFHITLAPDEPSCEITEIQLQTVLDILRANAAEATAMLSTRGDSAVQKFVCALDSRKTVRDAAKKAMKDPEETEDDPEQTADNPEEAPEKPEETAETAEE